MAGKQVLLLYFYSWNRLYLQFHFQSADRCHRIGQKRPCVITRLVVEDSIESRIVMLQEKKAHMINSTVNKDDVSMEKLTPQDMQFLFRGN